MNVRALLQCKSTSRFNFSLTHLASIYISKCFLKNGVQINKKAKFGQICKNWKIEESIFGTVKLNFYENYDSK